MATNLTFEKCLYIEYGCDPCVFFKLEPYSMNIDTKPDRSSYEYETLEINVKGLYKELQTTTNTEGTAKHSVGSGDCS